MEASESITTQPTGEKEKAIFDKIDSTLGEYALYLAQDHQRVLQESRDAETALWAEHDRVE